MKDKSVPYIGWKVGDQYETIASRIDDALGNLEVALGNAKGGNVPETPVQVANSQIVEALAKLEAGEPFNPREITEPTEAEIALRREKANRAAGRALTRMELHGIVTVGSKKYAIAKDILERAMLSQMTLPE